MRRYSWHTVWEELRAACIVAPYATTPNLAATAATLIHDVREGV